MVLSITPQVNKGWKAKDFHLISVDSNQYNFQNIERTYGLVVVFLCNHCPYVKSIITKVVREAEALTKLGIGFVAINSNDGISYPEDSYENMKLFATKNNFQFPYLFDETQKVAKSYNAVCTPDFFGFNSALELQYRGRLDPTDKDITANAKSELYVAMKEILETSRFEGNAIPSIGCSIKWR